MIIVQNVKVSLDDYQNLKGCCAKELRTSIENIVSIEILKKSIDARKKSDVHFVYTFLVELKSNERSICHKCKNASEYSFDANDSFIPTLDKKVRPIIVGSGPAGLFCALEFVKYGYTPVIIERGKSVEMRVKDVQAFVANGQLNGESNIQFGEGGAGTFSDGKLNTGISSTYKKAVLKAFVEFGADEDILYDSHPHIGTDVLRNVVVNIRKYLEDCGAQYMFDTKMTDFVMKDGKVVGVKVENNGNISVVEGEIVVLAIGHSARDTFKTLYDRGVLMQQKNFAVGARIEHLREKIDFGRYGEAYKHPALEAASYNLSTRVDGEGLFTFCMCPGGVVVPATSDYNSVVTNGMSYRARDGVNSNSALLVGVNSVDFGSDDVLAGMYFQEKIERAAYSYSNSYKAPCQRLIDFINGIETTSLGSVMPTYSKGVVIGSVDKILPSKVASVIKKGVVALGRQLPGFDDGDAVLTAPETRSSSPVRILRDDTYQSNVKELYPCGEGAGYAGGITSSAVDGIKVARSAMIKK